LPPLMGPNEEPLTKCSSSVFHLQNDVAWLAPDLLVSCAHEETLEFTVK